MMDKEKRNSKTEPKNMEKIKTTRRKKKEESAPSVRDGIIATGTTPDISVKSVINSIRDNITQMCATHDTSDYRSVIINVVQYVKDFLNIFLNDELRRPLYAQVLCNIVHDSVVVHIPDVDIHLDTAFDKYFEPYKRSITGKNCRLTVRLCPVTPGALCVSSEIHYFLNNTELTELNSERTFTLIIA